MMTNRNARMEPQTCSESNGILPDCAPLAVPYVPYQQMGGSRYSQQDALNSGTLFPGLNLPFRVSATPRNVVNSPLTELQALEFVLIELALYLDTHPCDSEAFAVYQQYCTLEQEARTTYEATYGPLFRPSTAKHDSWTAWLQDPWPWNYSEGGKE